MICLEDTPFVSRTCCSFPGTDGLKPRLQSYNVFRDRPPSYHVQAWYDEVRYYSYPYSQECNPHCPFRCSGPVCTHYTQVSLSNSSSRPSHFLHTIPLHCTGVLITRKVSLPVVEVEILYQSKLMLEHSCMTCQCDISQVFPKLHD